MYYFESFLYLYSRFTKEKFRRAGLCLFTADEIYKFLSKIDEKNTEFKSHFLDRFIKRAQICDSMPQDLTDFKKILLNSFPVYIDYQENNELKNENEYKVFYNINEKHDIVIVLSLIKSSPVKVKFITVYPQHVNRRLKINERHT